MLNEQGIILKLSINFSCNLLHRYKIKILNLRVEFRTLQILIEYFHLIQFLFKNLMQV